MKKTTFLGALVCTMMFTAQAVADTVTYDFVVADEGTVQLPTWGDEVTSGGVTLNLLAAGSSDFDNRFAVGPSARNNDSGNCFKFRTAGDWRGLWSQYADRNISVLNLKQGDKVTFVISKDDQTLKFVDGDVVISGQEYTVENDGNLDFVTTGSVYIESITITPAFISTGITEMKDEKMKMKDGVYDLQGRQLKMKDEGLTMKNGIYIVNGKKVLVK